MSKNLTRKGLAFGALVALGSSVVAGAPANAAPTSLAIASSFGTSTSTILGLDFNVAVTAAGLSNGTGAEFKLFVEGAVAGDFKAATTASRSVTDLTTAEGSTYNTDSASITTVSATDKTSVVADIDTDAATYTQIKLGLSSSAVTATRTIKVTPFVDNIVADGKITAGELAGTPISITYVKGSEVTATTTLAAPVIGGTDLSATVTLDKSINLEQVVASNTAVKVFFKKNGTYALTSDAVSKVDAVWSKADAALKASLSGVASIGSSQVYSATALINDLASGNVSTGTATAGETELDDASVTSGALTSTKGANIKDVNSSYGVRTGTTSVAITSAAAKKLNDDSNLVAASGVPAKVTVTATTLGTGSKFTAGGKTVDTQGESISFATVTNADGKVAFDLGATGAKLDKATVAVSVLDKTSNYIDFISETWTWIDATVNVEAVDLDKLGSSQVRAVKAGGSYTLNLALADDFGALYAGTARRATVSISNPNTVVAALSQNVTFSGGKASLVINDANSDNGYYTLNYRVQEYTASTDSWANVGSGSSTTVYVQKNVTAGFLTATATSTSAAIEYDALTAQDRRLDTNSTDVSVYATAATVAGTVLDTDGTVLEGAPVTLAGAGLLFKSGDVTTVGSITVLADNTGAYSVEVSSNKAGKQTVTVTSGSLSKTATPDFGTAAPTAAENITITAPANATPGSTTAVTVKLTDKFGNAVKTDGASGLTFTVRVSGVGSTGSFTEATNADGEVKFNQVLGSADTGSFLVTVKYDGDAATTTKAAITKTATVTVAAAAAPVAVEPTSKIGTANSRVYVNVKDGKGSVVSVKIGAKWFTKSALNNDYTFSFKAKKKSKVSVKVYVDGDLSSSKTITVK